MINAMLMRFDAPLMSFGSVMVDRHGFTGNFPLCSMVTGLLANALGFDHSDSAEIQALQDRVQFAVRCDRPGRKFTDFQTVDLGQPFLRQGWTTRGGPEGRAGSVSDGTHIRLRHYLNDAVYTLALTLDPAEGSPDLIELGMALREPERPLFLGRKSCIPAAPIFLDLTRGPDLRTILEACPALPFHRSMSSVLKARWPAELEGGKLVHVTDERDWTNQIHVGRTAWREGDMLPVPHTMIIEGCP